MSRINLYNKSIVMVLVLIFTITSIGCSKTMCAIEGCENDVVDDSIFEHSYCNKHLAYKKALESSREIYANINIAYNICSEMGSDIVDAWRMGIYDDDKLVENGVSFLNSELSLTEEEIVYSVGYFTCTIFFGNEWTEETAKETKESFSLETANAMFTLADGTFYDMFQFCVKIVQDAYSLNGDIDEARNALNTAKELMKELNEKHPDFEYYSVLKDYYLSASTLLDFCIEPNGAFDHVKDTINSYKDDARKSINELEFVLSN